MYLGALATVLGRYEDAKAWFAEVEELDTPWWDDPRGGEHQRCCRGEGCDSVVSPATLTEHGDCSPRRN